MKSKTLFSLLVLTLVTTSCAQKVEEAAGTTADTQTKSSRASSDDSRAIRLCETELVGATKSRLISFFGGQFPISNLEGPATTCFTTLPKGTGTANLDLFRVEYEDDYGVTYAEFDNSHVLQGTQKYENNKWVIDFVLADAFGVVGIKGQSGTDSDVISLTIKFANLGSFEDELKKQVEELANKCRTGQMTVAQCMGYNFPTTKWWEDPNYLSQFENDYTLTKAKELLNGTSAQTLGTMVVNARDL